MQEPTLEAVVRRLIDQGQLAELPAEDLAQLEALCSPATPRIDDARRPLWSFIRDAIWDRFPAVTVQIMNIDYDADDLESLLQLCGARGEHRLSVVGLLSAEVTREGLVKGIERGLVHHETDVRDHALLIAGLAGLHEFSGAIERILHNHAPVLGYTEQRALEFAIRAALLLGMPVDAESVLAMIIDGDLSRVCDAYLHDHPEVVDPERVPELLAAPCSSIARAPASFVAPMTDIPVTHASTSPEVKVDLRHLQTRAMLAIRAADPAGIGELHLDVAAMICLEALRSGCAGEKHRAEEFLGKVAPRRACAALPMVFTGRVPTDLDPGEMGWFGAMAYHAAALADPDPASALAQRRDNAKDVQERRMVDLLEALHKDPGSRRTTWLADSQRGPARPAALLTIEAICQAHDWPVPVAAEEMRVLACGPRRELVEFYRQHPGRWASALRLLANLEGGEKALRLVQSLAVDLADVVPVRALEETIFRIGDQEELAMIGLDYLVAMGSPTGLMRTLLHAAATPSDGNFLPRDADWPYLPILARHPEEHLRNAVLRSLAGADADGYGPEVLEAVVSVQDPTQLGEMIDFASAISESSHPLLHDAALVSREQGEMSELMVPGLLAVHPDASFRRRFARYLGWDRGDLPGQVAVLGAMVWDEDSDVRGDCLASLARLIPDDPDLRRLVAEILESRDATEAAVAAVAAGEIGDLSLLAALIQLANVPQFQVFPWGDGGTRSIAVAGIEKMIDAHPECGLMVLSITSGEDIGRRYGLSRFQSMTKREREEKLALLLEGLEKRADAQRARELRGRKVLVSRVGKDFTPGAVPGGLTVEDWEKLVLYLEPMFAGEDGDVVAVVGERAAGTLLTGLLEREDLVVVVGGWG